MTCCCCTPSLDSVPFERVFSRMTGEELVRVASAYSLLNGSPTVPSGLSADGALTWLGYNGGAGKYYASWSPATAGDVTLWLDAQDLSKLWVDAAKTTAATAGSRVGAWVNKGSVTLDMAQSTTTPNDYRPELVANAWQNFYAVRFDPLAENLGTASRFLTSSAVNASSILLTDKPFTLLLAILPRQILDERTLVRDSGGNTVLRFEASDPNKDFDSKINASASSVVATSVKLLDTQSPAILLTQYVSGTAASGAGLRLSVNGSGDVAADRTGNISQSGVLGIPGTADAGQFKGRFDLLEAIILSGDSADYDSAERTAAAYYLAARYGLSWQTATYRYLGNVFTQNRRPHEVRDLLETNFTTSPSTFLGHVVGSNTWRTRELTTDPPIAASPTLDLRTPTKIVFWDSFEDVTGNYNKLLTAYPGIDSRANLVRVVAPWFGQNGGSWNALDATYIKNKLAAQPAGRRWLKLAAFNCPVGVPTNIGGTQRYSIYDGEFGTKKRSGISLETWLSQILNTSTSPILQLLDSIKSSGGPAILDGVVLDIERWQTFYHLKHAVKFANYGLASSRYVATVSANVWTTKDESANVVSHGFANGDPVALITSNTLPTGVVLNKLYYARAESATTLSLYDTAANAQNPPSTTGLITVTGSGAGTHYICRESWTHIFSDETWNDEHGSLPTGTRGAVKPVLAQSVYDTYNAIDPATHEAAMLYDTWAYNYWTSSVRKLFDKFRERFPALLASDYDTALLAGGIYTSERANGATATSRVYGGGDNPGAIAMHFYGDSYGSRWNWRQLAEQNSSGDTAWSAFTTQIMRLRQVLAASGLAQFNPWLSHKYLPGSSLGTGGLWAEVVLHVAMAASGVANYFNANFPGGFSDADIAKEQKDFVDLIAECDNVLYYNSVRDPGEEILDYNAAFLAQKVFAGGRWVFRVTPNPVATGLTVTSGVNDLVFTNSLGSFTIPRAGIHPQSRSTLAPLGYWVQQSAEPCP